MHHSPAERSWFALRVRSRHERIVASALCDKGNEVFLPLYRCERRWSDRIKELELPLFPGYLFCRFDILNRLPILVTPGILHIVGIGRVPYPVDEAELEALKTIVISRLGVEPWPLLEVGQRVRIESGPLAGVEGILVVKKTPLRLVVSVTLLQRSVAVEIDHGWVTQIGAVNSRLKATDPLRPLDSLIS
ncbi:MAG: NusG-like protein [Acidobacteria bacterium]|nr:MAG: NusG-like protein [Acidobacteriota bacterium]